MSDNMTSVRMDGVRPGIMHRGHISYREAIEMAVREYQRELEHAYQALRAIRDGRVQVVHHRGVYVTRDERVVPPDGEYPVSCHPQCYGQPECIVYPPVTLNSDSWPVWYQGREYGPQAPCPECGVPWDKRSPGCPRMIFDRHPR